MKRHWKWLGWGVVALMMAFGLAWIRDRLCPPAATHVAVASAPQLLEKRDCAEVLKGDAAVHLAPGSLMIQVIDRTSHPSEANIAKLISPACLSMYGARQAAAEEREDTSWFSGLPFTLHDDLDGLADQARFVRGMPWDEFPRSVEVGLGMSSAYRPNELIWAMGHEFGHGVYGHAMSKIWIVPVSVGIIILGAWLWGYHAAGPWRRNLGRLVAAFGLAGVIGGTAMISKHYELSADTFGVHAAARTGMGLARGKEVALDIFRRHPAPSDCWWTCSGINRDVHPATETRVRTVAGLQ